MKKRAEKVVCIVQARMGSTRLPGKIFLKLSGKPVLEHVVSRLQLAKRLDAIVVAAPVSPENDRIERFIKTRFPDIMVYRGSERDVLDRYYRAAKVATADIVVRVTSDCPLIDPNLVDRVVVALQQDVDYASNTFPTRTYPRGMDTEVIRMNALARLWCKATSADDREHVTLYLRMHPHLFSVASVKNPTDFSRYRLTIDEPLDFQFLTSLYRYFRAGSIPYLRNVMTILKAHPELAKINMEVKQKHATV